MIELGTPELRKALERLNAEVLARAGIGHDRATKARRELGMTRTTGRRRWTAAERAGRDGPDEVIAARNNRSPLAVALERKARGIPEYVRGRRIA